jgi:hypothetical protein
MTHIGNKYKPNVIIDDGSHLAAHNMISFRVMFPHLASGGIYVIEDIYLHYPTPSVYTAGADELPADYFAALAVKLAAEDAARAGAGRERNDILSFISRIEFFRRAVLIQKKSEVEPGKIVIEAWPLVEKAKSTYLWHTIGTFVLRNGLELGMAEEAARRAISLAPSSPNNFVRLADVLERQGRIKEALDAALTASVLAADPTQINSLVSRLDARLAGQSNGPAIETP